MRYHRATLVFGPEFFVEANRLAELALARLSALSGLGPSVDWSFYWVPAFQPQTLPSKLLAKLGIAAKLTGQKKNRSYSYQRHSALLSA